MAALDALPSVIGAADAPGVTALPAGDLDGDGRGDLVVGSPYDDTSGHESGAVYVLYEVAGLGFFVPIAEAGEQLTGENPQDHAGYALAALGDADGDGRDDLAIGAPDASGSHLVNGRVYVVYGGDRVTSGSLAPSFAFQGGDNHARIGFRLFAPGDTDGDGLADLLISAPVPSPTGALDPGWMALVRGVPGGWEPYDVLVRADKDTAETSADVGFVVREPATMFGRAAAVVPGDDGLPDLLVAAPGVDPEGGEAAHASGTVYTFDLPVAGTGVVISEESATASIVGEHHDQLAWKLVPLEDGRVAMSVPQRDEATGALLLSDDAGALVVIGRGAAAGDTYGWALDRADGVFDGALAVGVPGALGAAGRVAIIRPDGTPITTLDGCWPHGWAGDAITWGDGPDPSGADRGWLAITAPTASVAADGDGVVYVLTADDLPATNAACADVMPWTPYSPPVDGDGDGFVAEDDCDDGDPLRSPGAVESCGDGLDDNCDGARDEGCAVAESGCSTGAGGASLGFAGVAGIALLARRRWAAVVMGLGLAGVADAAEFPVDVRAIAVIEGYQSLGYLRGPVVGGDFDGDGTNDLAVASPQAMAPLFASGAVWLMPNASLRGPSTLAGAVMLAGDSEHDRLGVSLAVLPGPPDRADGLIIGADHTGLNERDEGITGIWRAPATATFEVAAHADYTLGGDDPEDAFGAQVAVGDFDGDGTLDQAIAAPFRDFTEVDDTITAHSGRVWIVHGSVTGPTGARKIDAIATATIDGTGREQYLGWRLLCPGDLDGDGRDDLIVGLLGGQPRYGGRLAWFSGVEKDAHLAQADAGGEWFGTVRDGRFGEAIAARGGVVAVGTPYAGPGRVWLFDRPPSGQVPADSAAKVIWDGTPGEAAGSSVAIGPAILVGAPEVGRVYVLDDDLVGDDVLVGGGRTGEYVGFVPDVDGDAVEDAVIIDPTWSGAAPAVGRVVLLSGASVAARDFGEGPGAFDRDGDGSAEGVDCDDGDPRRSPDRDEVCAGVLDEDCDGVIDESCTCATTPAAGLAAVLVASALVLRRRRALVVIGLVGCAPSVTPPTLTLPPDPLFGLVSGTASADADRIVIAVDGDEIGGGDGPEVTFVFDSALVDDGAHLVRATAYVGEDASDVWQMVQVRQSAGDREPPRVRFLAPVEGAVIPEEPYVILDVGDDVGIAHVEVRDGDVLLGILPPEGPWELRWQDAPEGRHTLVAEVTDVADNRTTADLHIVVGELP